MINSSSATAAAHRDPSLERRLENPKILSGAQLQAEGFHDLQDRVEARAPLAKIGLAHSRHEKIRSRTRLLLVNA
jgi:hypothetical protein